MNAPTSTSSRTVLRHGALSPTICRCSAGERMTALTWCTRSIRAEMSSAVDGTRRQHDHVGGARAHQLPCLIDGEPGFRERQRQDRRMASRALQPVDQLGADVAQENEAEVGFRIGRLTAFDARRCKHAYRVVEHRPIKRFVALEPGLGHADTPEDSCAANSETNCATQDGAMGLCRNRSHECLASPPVDRDCADA